jgi:hypothetical protein
MNVASMIEAVMAARFGTAGAGEVATLAKNEATGWMDAVRPSTARCARAQDEVISLMPRIKHLILSSAAGEAEARVEGRNTGMRF